MFFLYDMFQDVNALNPTGNNQYFDTVRISSGIFDHLNLANAIEISTTIPIEWGTNTLLNANFLGTIDGGSISQLITNIDHLNIQRQEEDTTSWITLQQIYKNYTTQAINASFTMEDTYEKNNTKYTYRIVPVDALGNVGTAIEQQVLSMFNDAYIADASHIYNITNEYQIGSSQKNQVSAVYTPYGSQYPFVAYNAVTKYDTGNVTAILIAPTSMNGFIDRNAQTNLVEEFNTWLTNGRAKILKDFNGKLKVVNIINAIPNEYYKELGNGLASTSFDFIEVGSFSQEYLDKLGMTNNFPLEYKTQNGSN